ncbi:uncharacterized protein RCC_02925 [Ramularia collo-cygni]|uniref:RNA polymerase I-specific transcription initiation factor RRN6-like protein n=1 Tax=Ramularia collo-cygni TaxID=112498 RepID=A0A2D3V9K3_9PEZI|nr:uncharacterized protein RCC_02925 [Ramularia collo-cygni]CZT17093.1 uncharacterized protein RCC_02925 [Ramularia collo-cygni]
MADRARCDLPYGHFGRGIYSSEDHAWHFERTLTVPSTTQLLGESKVLSQPSNVPLDAHRGGPPSKRHREQIKSIAGVDPRFQPASGIIAPLLRVSEAVQDAVHCYDPLRGCLIASGDIQSFSRNRSVPVVAYVTGGSGCDLSISQVQKQKRGWDDNRRSWLEVPTLQGEQANWSSHGGPIHQVRFASNARSGPGLLAARQLTRTTIIRAVQVKRPSEEVHGASIIPASLFNVSMEQTGGNSHIDVSFNPWFSQQVALIDVAGMWTVLEFSTRNMAHVSRTWSSMAQKSAGERRSSIHDGWARIAWVLNTESLAVCTRQSLTLFNIVNDSPTLIEEVELGLYGPVPWILDFLVFPNREDHFCVLTSTHVLVYKVADSTTLKKITASMRFRIRHYKNPEDLSLRLTTWKEDEEGGTGILVYSTLPGLTSTYRLNLSEPYHSVNTDYIDFQSLWAPNGANKPGSGVSIDIRRFDMAHKPTMNVWERPFKAARFSSALLVSEDLGACQTLLCTGNDEAIPPLIWEAKLPISSFKLSHRHFVAEDLSPEFDDPAQRRIEPSARRSRYMKIPDSLGGRTIDLEQVTNLLQSPVRGTETLEDVLALIKSELARSDLDSITPMRTLYSFAETELEIGNTDDCSEALDQLSQPLEDQMMALPGQPLDMGEKSQRLMLASIEVPSSLGLEHLRLDASLSSVYDRTLAAWITPLSENIPGRVRIARAKLCGVVAAQLLLASRSLQIQDPPDSQPSQEQTQTQTQSQDPYHGGMPSSSQLFHGHGSFALSQLNSSQTFPSSALPTPSQTPSITTASSHPSAYAAPELHRLSKYTAFSQTAPPALPRSLNNVLSHWKVGEDIKNYDWMSTSRTLAQQDEEADDDMTEADRRRAQRRAEKHMRRQRREAAASQAQLIASSQAPEIYSASQPTMSRVESQPSGMLASSQFTGRGPGTAATSQVEAGRFGGKLAATAGKKRRRQGF